MADILVELDQADHKEFDLGQTASMDMDMGDVKAVYLGGIDYEEDPVDSGFVWYNEETKKYQTITPDNVVTEDSENIVSSKAVHDYVETNGGKIDTISVDGENIEIDENKNVNIDLSGKVDKPSKSVVQQVVTIKPNDGDTEGIGLASASSDAIFGRIPRYQNPAYDNADTPPQNMGNLVVADPTKPLHVANKRWSENNFVAKNTNETTTQQVYAKEKDGTQTMLNAVQYYTDDRNGLARFINGNLIVNTPTEGAHATHKSFVEDNFVAKNKRLTGNRVYASQSSKDADGNDVFTDNTIGYATGEQASTLALRGAGGTIAVGNPTQSAHATTKQYVDDKFAGQGTVTAGKSPQYTSDGNIAVGNAKYGYEAINKKYVDDKFNGANKAVSFVNYSSMITSLNALGNTSYSVGQNIMIVTLEVPDLWVSEIAETSIAYTYVSDDDFVNELNTNGSVQVGYYKLSALETQKVDLTEYVKNTDDPTTERGGVVRISTLNYGLEFVPSQHAFRIKPLTDNKIENRQDYGFEAVTLAKFDKTLKASMTDNKETWTDDEKKSARTLIGASNLNTHANYGAQNNATGLVMLVKATDDEIKNRSTAYKPIVPTNLDVAVTQALIGKANETTNEDGTTTTTYEHPVTLSDEEKASARELIGALEQKNKSLNNGVHAVYGIDGNTGKQVLLEVDSTGKKYYHLVRQKENGRVLVGNATEDMDAVNLQTLRKTYATDEVGGVAKWVTGFGLKVDQYGRGQILGANNDEITAKTQEYKPITPKNLDFAIVQGLNNNSITLDEVQKSAIQSWLGITVPQVIILED